MQITKTKKIEKFSELMKTAFNEFCKLISVGREEKQFRDMNPPTHPTHPPKKTKNHPKVDKERGFLEVKKMKK